ncbi:hypothetical protein niasHT_033801 [Heterodera trifolii]|uniref:BTB domain-containing protein n=1 Tax=Heterodera trifolii TaxID=157864 RepID=A0ABD2J7E5_9BILA
MDKLADRMNRLLSTGVDSDVHFLLLPAHKPILRIASDVFDAMFRFDKEFPIFATPKPGKKDGNSPVEIPDVNVEAFKTMLSFIYTDDLSGVNGNNAIDVLYAAKKYNLPSLVEACVKISIKELSNVFIAFSKARLLEEKVQLWAIEQCKQKGVESSPKNQRQMLGPALYKIRFPIIQKYFLELIVSSGVLTSDELVSVLLYHSSSVLSILYPLPFPVHERSAKSTGKLTLKIEKFSEFARQKELSRKYSDSIYIDGFQWKIIFAQLQSKSGTKYLGFFIQCNADDYGSDWSCTCSATLCVVPKNEENTHYNRSSKTFDHSFCSKKENPWGFTEFMAIEKLMHPGADWYNEEEDTVTLSAHLTTVGLHDYDFYEDYDHYVEDDE